MSLDKFNRTGVFTNGIKVSELIEILKEYMEFAGDNEIDFHYDGEDDCFVQFDFYTNKIAIYVEGEDPR